MGEQETASSSHQGVARVSLDAAKRLRGADVTAIAAETAYYAILAIAPFLIFLIAGLALISQSFQLGIVDDFQSIVQRMAPGGTGDLLEPLFDEAGDRASQGTASLGMLTAFLIAIWSGSRAIGALLKGFGRIARDASPPPALFGRLMSLFLAIVMGVVVILSFTVLLFGGAVARAIAEWLGLGGTFSTLWLVISWPLVALIVALVIAILFRFGKAANGYLSPGVVVATALWFLIMIGIRIYLAIIDPASIFGALGSFIVLVVFFFIMSLALLIGAAVNAVLRVPEPQAGESGSD